MLEEDSARDEDDDILPDLDDDHDEDPLPDQEKHVSFPSQDRAKMKLPSLVDMKMAHHLWPLKSRGSRQFLEHHTEEPG